MENTLHDFFESSEEIARRDHALEKLTKIIQELAKAPIKIETMGSYRLGVYQKDADIDILIITPDSSNFFNDLERILSGRPEVTKLLAVKDANTPILKLIFDGIHMDLQYANTDDLLHQTDRSIRSLNGPRVADEILRLVDHKTFKTALSAIKFWAQRRAIHSNIVGYLGGIAWAIMTAHVCQLYPTVDAETIVHEFFNLYANWSWPNPVLLQPLETSPMGFRVWSPAKEYMPIITPVYPAMCASYNVIKSTFDVITKEIARANDICKLIKEGQSTWDELFFTTDSQYHRYLTIRVTKDDRWCGFVMSRLKMLAHDLEMVKGVECAVPCVSGVPSQDHTVTFFIGLNLEGPVNISDAIQYFQEHHLLWIDRQPHMTCTFNVIEKNILNYD